MKIQLLIGICQSDYAEHLSRVLAEKHADVFEVIVCSKPELLGQTMDKRRFDAALLDGEMAGAADLSAVRLPLLVWDGASPLEGAAQDLPRVRKYQRISAISSDVVERYAAISGPQESFQSSRAKITAVWSPAGGSGKTAVALALAARRAAQGRQTVYLDLEPFSALQSYFKEPGKSISGVFEKLDGDVALLFQGIRQRDSASGVYYFGGRGPAAGWLCRQRRRGGGGPGQRLRWADPQDIGVGRPGVAGGGRQHGLPGKVPPIPHPARRVWGDRPQADGGGQPGGPERGPAGGAGAQPAQSKRG